MSFSDRVYAAVRKIPKGQVSTYKEVAHEVGTRAYRAIGQVLAQNPHTDVPCHRVIRSDLLVGGFFGSDEDAAVLEKKALLEDEGVLFDGDRVDKDCIFFFTQYTQ